jgi:hypothetical protein
MILKRKKKTLIIVWKKINIHKNTWSVLYTCTFNDTIGTNVCELIANFFGRVRWWVWFGRGSACDTSGFWDLK